MKKLFFSIVFPLVAFSTVGCEKHSGVNGTYVSGGKKITIDNNKAFVQNGTQSGEYATRQENKTILLENGEREIEVELLSDGRVKVEQDIYTKTQ